MKRIFSLALMVLTVIMMTSCKHQDETDVLNIKINGECYSISLQKDTVVNLVTLSTEFDAEVEVENASMFQELSIGGKSATSGFVKVPVAKIATDVQIPIVYRSGDYQGTILVNTLNAQIPPMAVTGKATSEGDFYLSFVHTRLVMKMDNDGNILFYRCNSEDFQSSNNTGWWDFKKHNIGGRTYYSYHANDPKFSGLVISGYDPGMRVILDDHYKVVKNIQLLTSGPYVHNGDPIDGHDFYMYDLDHYIVSSYIDRNIGDKTVASAYLQEVNHGKVVFDWWSVDHPEMEGMFDETFSSTAGKDYVHFNAIQVLPDGNWLCSFRNISSVLKIDRSDTAGNILWRISGEAQPSAYSFCGQHYARLNGTTLTLFDNGNGHPTPASRPLQLTINPLTGDVSDGGELVHGGEYFTQACGSVCKSGNNYIVGWGFPGGATVNDRIVIEYDASGNEIFGLRNTGNYLNTNAFRCSYRCVKM